MRDDPDYWVYDTGNEVFDRYRSTSNEAEQAAIARQFLQSGCFQGWLMDRRDADNAAEAITTSFMQNVIDVFTMDPLGYHEKNRITFTGKVFEKNTEEFPEDYRIYYQQRQFFEYSADFKNKIDSAFTQSADQSDQANFYKLSVDFSPQLEFCDNMRQEFFQNYDPDNLLQLTEVQKKTHFDFGSVGRIGYHDGMEGKIFVCGRHIEFEKKQTACDSMPVNFNDCEIKTDLSKKVHPWNLNWIWHRRKSDLNLTPVDHNTVIASFFEKYSFDSYGDNINALITVPAFANREECYYIIAHETGHQAIAAVERLYQKDPQTAQEKFGYSKRDHLITKTNKIMWRNNMDADTGKTINHDLYKANIEEMTAIDIGANACDVFCQVNGVEKPFYRKF